MKKKISHISPFQFGLTVGLCYALILCLVIPLGFLYILFKHDDYKDLGAGLFVIFLPVLYGVLSFLFAMFAAVVYNFIAHFTGGIEVTVTDASL